jgi:glycerophosphoryl diester phosphodiesterase
MMITSCTTLQSRHFCRIFAHRGANRQAGENTRSAFDKALEYAIDGLETDVQLTRDCVPVLWHDRFLDKFGLPELRIDEFDFDPLNRLSAGTGYELMSLQTFINLYRRRRSLNLEVKIYDRESSQRQHSKILLILDMVGTSCVEDVFISSSNLDWLIFARQSSACIPLFYVLDDHQTPGEVETVLREQPFLQGFCLPISLINPSVVKTLRDNDKSIVAYTCNNEAEILKALMLKADILISDDPQLALHLRG